MTIEELKPSQRVKGRYLVKLDEGTILRVSEQEILDFALYTGKELSIDEAQALEKAGFSSGLKTKAYNAISRKPLSRFDLEQKLRHWEASEEEILAICDRFEELNLLNDGQFAKTLALHYHRKGYGTRKIQQEFHHHGVAREFWEDALLELEELEEDEMENPILKFLNQTLKGEKPDTNQLKRVPDALARRGFSWSEIREAVLRYDESMSQLWEEEDSI